MNIILVLVLAASLVLVPRNVAVEAENSASGPPPVEQPLVREGEFAVELASALNLTSSRDEAAAESYLSSISITPRNGWISDYPMTPAIIAEVKESTAKSAASGNLKISETDAADLVDKVSAALNLPVKVGYEPGTEYQSQSAAPPPDASEYVEPSVVEDYYYDNLPPVVTYYPPPWEYESQYDWVPSPFCWGGYGFGGFFILEDFYRHHHFHHITNHVKNADGAVSRINAATRAGAATPARQTWSKAGAANAATQKDFRSSGSAGNTGRSMRDMDRFSSSPRASSEATFTTPSHEGRTSGSTPSPHSSPGGGYSGGSHGGFHGGGGGHGGGGRR